MAKATQPAAVPDSETYQQLRQKLDETVAKLQDPNCDVDQAVDLYEQALGVVKQLEQHLQNAENRVTKIQAQLS